MIHSVEVVDKLRFLAEVARLLPRGRMSVEGNLRGCRFPKDALVGRAPAGGLKRNTLFPLQQFAIVSLEPESLAEIIDQVAAAGVEISGKGILHVAIEADGELQLGAYDNFDEGCVFTGPAISPQQLEQWRTQGIINSFTPEPNLRP